MPRLRTLSSAVSKQVIGHMAQIFCSYDMSYTTEKHSIFKSRKIYNDRLFLPMKLSKLNLSLRLIDISDRNL